MRIKISGFLFLLVISKVCFSQNKEARQVMDVTKVTFFNPGTSYEKAIKKRQTVYGQAFMNTDISIVYSSSLGNTSSINFDPALRLQYRHYYNYNKREQKGKRTERNSLNYISPTFVSSFSKKRISVSHFIETKRRPVNTIGMAWGFQEIIKAGLA